MRSAIAADGAELRVGAVVGVLDDAAPQSRLPRSGLPAQRARTARTPKPSAPPPARLESALRRTSTAERREIEGCIDATRGAARVASERKVMECRRRSAGTRLPSRPRECRRHRAAVEVDARLGDAAKIGWMLVGICLFSISAAVVLVASGVSVTLPGSGAAETRLPFTTIFCSVVSLSLRRGRRRRLRLRQRLRDRTVRMNAVPTKALRANVG